VLGRHREDDSRSGWISGLSEAEGEAHPTRGGLRIGKRLPERSDNEPFDERLEWERDGQYFHYLTKWMHALDQASRFAGDPRYKLWARELALTAHDAFSYDAGQAPRMYWKMSIDLSRALVPSMGQHDPLDGYLTALQLSAPAGLPQTSTGAGLTVATRRFAEMLEGMELGTPDPLGIGGLLTDSWRLLQLIDPSVSTDRDLLERLLITARAGLEHYSRNGAAWAPAGFRLAFRELGLAIGLHALEHMQHAAARHPEAITPGARRALEALAGYLPLGQEIESFWRRPVHRDNETWSEHRDINEVMLATSLVPEGFLMLGP
jgi:hypothetical protein